jgi:N-acyl-D-amino-acid deacylase
LGQSIRSASGLPAEILGFTDRGFLRAEYHADVVVFSPEEILDQATFQDPHRYATGIRYVFVNGTPAVHQGTPTGALSGRSLRHVSKVAEEPAIPVQPFR